MASDAFVNLVTFQATGLDKIELDLAKAKTASDKLAPSMEKVFGVTKRGTRETQRGTQELTRTIETLGRTAQAYQKSFAFTLAGLGPDNPRYAQGLSYRGGGVGGGGYSVNPAVSAAMSARWTWGGFASGVGGTVGAIGTGAGAAAFGTGIAGLSGTATMARLQNQFQRLAWELGNTLTPQVEAATKRIAGAANWMSRQDTGTQDAIGYGVTGLGLYAGARLAGIPVGAGAAGLGRMLGRGFGALGGRSAAIGMPGAGILPNSLALDAGGSATTGMGGFGDTLGRWGKRLPWLGIASMAGEEIFGSERTRARRGTSTSAELAPFTRMFQGMFSGSSDKAGDMQKELERLKDQELIASRAKGPISTAELLRNGSGPDVERLVTVRQQMQALQGLMGQGPDHRGNALVGGGYGEIGSGYYTAASALAQTGFGMRDAEGQPMAPPEQKDIATILEQIRDKIPGKDDPADPGSGNRMDGVSRAWGGNR